MSSISDAHRFMAGANALPDSHSFGVYKMLLDVYPAFAKKLFENNVLMEKLLMSGYNPMSILDYPVCGSCETLALWMDSVSKDGKVYNRCGCVAKGCGKVTTSPITFREWVTYELKKKVPADFIDGLEFAVDNITESMIRKYYNDNQDILIAHNQRNRSKLGAIYDDKGHLLVNAKEEKPERVYGKPDIKADIEL